MKLFIITICVLYELCLSEGLNQKDSVLENLIKSPPSNQIIKNGLNYFYMFPNVQPKRSSKVDTYIVKLFDKSHGGDLIHKALAKRLTLETPNNLQKKFSGGILSAKKELFDDVHLNDEEKALANSIKEILTDENLHKESSSDQQRCFKRSDREIVCSQGPDYYSIQIPAQALNFESALGLLRAVKSKAQKKRDVDYDLILEAFGNQLVREQRRAKGSRWIPDPVRMPLKMPCYDPACKCITPMPTQCTPLPTCPCCLTPATTKPRTCCPVTPTCAAETSPRCPPYTLGPFDRICCGDTEAPTTHCTECPTRCPTPNTSTYRYTPCPSVGGSAGPCKQTLTDERETAERAENKLVTEEPPGASPHSRRKRNVLRKKLIRTFGRPKKRRNLATG